MAITWEKLIEDIRAGNVRSLARAITRVENRDPGWKEAMKALYLNGGNAKVIGITGSPGTGKSTLTNVVAKGFVNRGFTVGVIAVDPSSPFSGGALLGDRLRMKDIVTIKEVFVRSMATRGALGGLCQGARDVARLLDAFGKDIIIIETVGVGQDEIEVVKTADLVVVVCVPGQGDGIQALKAGIMEIADIYVVNKADRDGADEVMADIGGMLEIASKPGKSIPPVLKTSAIKGQGIDELLNAVIKGIESGKNKDIWQAKRVREEILILLESEILEILQARLDENGDLDKAVAQILGKKTDPYSVADKMLSLIREII